MNAPVSTEVVQRQPSEITVVRESLEKMGTQFAAALPSHIPLERFKRVVLTAVQNNPELLECDRRSLWNAAMRAAQDGLLPDGREGAMVVRRARSKAGEFYKEASWQIMVGGIRKKVRNSDEIATWDAYVVYAKDEFDYQLGDDPYIRHKPFMGGDRGPIVAAYSVAVLKSGEKSREVMTIHEIHLIRDTYSDGWKAFRAQKIKSTPWSTAEGEMCRKTVARRHAKVLPMSTDLDELIRRDDELPDRSFSPQPIATVAPQSVVEQLDGFAAEPETPPADTSSDPAPEAEPERDPRAKAFEEGQAAHAKRIGLRAVPPEYREKDKADLAEAWADGWREADKRAAEETASS